VNTKIASRRRNAKGTGVRREPRNKNRNSKKGRKKKKKKKQKQRTKKGDCSVETPTVGTRALGSPKDTLGE